MASITPIDLRELQNAAGAPAFPDSPPNTIYAEDYNPIRDAISKGTAVISTKGIVLGSDGLCTLGNTPVNMSTGLLIFQDAAAEDVQVGYLSNTGELGMVNLRADQKLFLGADADISHDGSATRSIPESSPSEWHLITLRGAGVLEDFDVQSNGTVEVIRKLQGDYAADKIGYGFIMRYAGGLSRIRMDPAGFPVIEDVVDYDARPITFDNERRIMTGVDVFVSDVTADPFGPIVVTEPSSDPKIKQIGITAIPASALAIGGGVDDVNVDNLFAGGGGSGVLAELTSPAEVAQISANAVDIAAIQAELLTVVKTFETSLGQTITPDGTGRITFANSGSVLWDKPTQNAIRAVASGGGGGGGAVNSVTGGDGIVNLGTAADPILAVDFVVAGGLVISGGKVTLDFVAAGGDVGTTTLPARSNHTHDALYAPIGFIPPGMATISDITYETLDGNGDVGTTPSTLAAGDDSRMTDARVPLVHDLAAAHSGVLPAVRVDPAYVPVNYTPASDDVDGHLEGLDGALTPTLVSLTDTPPNYTGHRGQQVTVNDTEDGVEFSNIATGSIEAPYQWSTNTTVSDPGSGFVKVNNADPTIATVVSISNTDQDGLARDGWPFLRIGDAIAIKDSKNSDTHVYEVAATATNNPGWDSVPVTHIFSRNGHANNGRVIVTSAFVGASNFTELNDTPAAYAGAAGLGLVVNGPETGLIYAAVGAGIDEETFNGFDITLVGAAYLIGSGVGGVTVRRAGTVNVARLKADVALAGGSSIEVTVSNLTTPASATITIAAGELFHEELGLGIAFLATEELDAQITDITGVPGVSELTIEVVRS